ncbi:MAG: hypothetical protein KAS32_07555 [Candidatus Peribacteraceae bacterium]|nr:hypothetical protein [Candidatus Peribacteraceae bacterium]
MKEISLTQNKATIVDDYNYQWLSKYKWYAKKDKYTYYAVRNSNKKGCEQKLIFMHREIIKTPSNKKTDHRNGNGLDNRELNIRICTNSQNNQNRHRAWGKSMFKGVSWYKRYKKWQVKIRSGKLIHCGYFHTEIEAAKRYDEKAKELFGEYANCNF